MIRMLWVGSLVCPAHQQCLTYVALMLLRVRRALVVLVWRRMGLVPRGWSRRLPPRISLRLLPGWLNPRVPHTRRKQDWNIHR